MSFKQDILLQRRVLVVGVLLMVIKVVAYFVTNSNAILSDALESIVNISSGSFALFSLWFASRPSDGNHPYGHGKIEFVSGFIEGVLIIVAGIMIVSKAVYNFIYPQIINELMIGVLLTALTGAVNFIMGFALKKQGQSKNSMILISGGTHLMSDGYTSFALVAGIFLVWLTNLVWVDNLLAVAFGVYIMIAGIKILRQSVAGILDEVDVVLVKKIIAVLESKREKTWIDIHNLRVVKYGRDVHVDCHVTLPWYKTLESSHEELIKIEGVVDEALQKEVDFFIHSEPCEEFSCSICEIENCEMRRREFTKRIEWSESNVLINKKHGLDS